ncbi:hypothetical protein BGZ98_009404 [Dissophora globulifera]|nr:hypothetical protein BGZ98_009404 [Dissophora globulifera]
MVGTNIMVLFGLTAGGATNNVFVLDTTTNTWQSSYAPSNLSQTSTKPEDWPGYKPPPPLPSRSPLGDGSPPQVEGKHKPSIGSIIGGIAGIVALTAILFVVVRRRRQHQIAANRAKTASYYRSDFAPQPVYRGEEAYQPTGMAFETSPSSFGQRMDQIWDSLGVVAFWRGDRRAANRSQSRRLEDQDDEDGARGLHMSPITDQDIFLDAVHRARSRVGRQSPAFAPLQQPIRPGSPSSPRSPRVASGAGSPLVGVEGEYEEVDTSAHGRSYSDGFENSMQEMDVQMVAVPRGRLYVVNPSDEALNIQEHRRDHVQVPGDDAPLESS